MVDNQENRYVTSAGAIVYKQTIKDPEFLLVQSYRGKPFWGFPKGGVEPGESLVEAAHREVLEEAGVRINVLRHKLPTCKTMNKTVHFWIANTWDVELDPTPNDPDKEIVAAKWFPADEVEALLHRYQRSVFKIALEIISSYYNPLGVSSDYWIPSSGKSSSLFQQCVNEVETTANEIYCNTASTGTKNK